MKKHLLSLTLLLACLALASNALIRAPATDRDTVVSDYTGEWVSTQEESPEQRRRSPTRPHAATSTDSSPCRAVTTSPASCDEPDRPLQGQGTRMATRTAMPGRTGETHNGDSLSHEEDDGDWSAKVVEDNPDRICEEKGDKTEWD